MNEPNQLPPALREQIEHIFADTFGADYAPPPESELAKLTESFAQLKGLSSRVLQMNPKALPKPDEGDRHDP